jgi:hypothetical protein
MPSSSSCLPVPRVRSKAATASTAVSIAHSGTDHTFSYKDDPGDHDQCPHIPLRNALQTAPAPSGAVKKLIFAKLRSFVFNALREQNSPFFNFLTAPHARGSERTGSPTFDEPVAIFHWRLATLLQIADSIVTISTRPRQP